MCHYYYISGTLSSRIFWCSRLAFRVLWSFAGALEAGLLAFLPAGVAGEEASFAKRLLPLGVDAQQSAGEGVADRACLTTAAATDDAHTHVKGIAYFEQAQRGGDGGGQGFALAKILTAVFAIDGDAAITVGEEAHAGYSRLAPSHAIVILAFVGIGHCRFSSSLLFCALGALGTFVVFGSLSLLQQCFRASPGNRLLRLVRMVRARVNLEVRHDIGAQAIMHNHATYRVLQRALREPAFERLAQSLFLEAARILAVAIVDFLIQASAGHGNFFRVNYDHKISTLQVRRERRLVFAA